MFHLTQVMFWGLTLYKEYNFLQLKLILYPTKQLQEQECFISISALKCCSLIRESSLSLFELVTVGLTLNWLNS